MIKLLQSVALERPSVSHPTLPQGVPPQRPARQVLAGKKMHIHSKKKSEQLKKYVMGTLK